MLQLITINAQLSGQFNFNLSEAIVYSAICELSKSSGRTQASNKDFCYYLPLVTDKPDTMKRIISSLKNKGAISVFMENKNLRTIIPAIREAAL